jgi:hypothetical protein
VRPVPASRHRAGELGALTHVPTDHDGHAGEELSCRVCEVKSEQDKELKWPHPSIMRQRRLRGAPFFPSRTSQSCCRSPQVGFTSERACEVSTGSRAFVSANIGATGKRTFLRGSNSNGQLAVPMIDRGGTVVADTGKSGRATERRHVARPRHQKGSIKSIGKKRPES